MTFGNTSHAYRQPTSLSLSLVIVQSMVSLTNSTLPKTKKQLTNNSARKKLMSRVKFPTVLQVQKVPDNLRVR